MSVQIHPGIEVFETDVRGRGARATQLIRAGTCLVREHPLAYVLLDHVRESRCEQCLQKRDKLQSCGGCKSVHYCSNDCQIAAYTSHQYECKIKKKNKHASLPESPARLLIRALCHKQKKKKTYSSIPAGFAMSVTDLCEGPEGLPNAKAVVKNLEDFVVGSSNLPGWDHDSLLNVCAKIVVNSFSLYDEELREVIGEGIFLRPSMFNHNCEPNCVFVFYGSTLEIRTVKDIQPGEECCIHYTRMLQTVNSRRQDLLKAYRFWCDCRRCKTEEKMLASADTSNRIKLEELEIKVNSYLATIDNKFDGNYYQVLEICQEALAATKSDVILAHPSVAELHIKAMEACIAIQKWNEAVKYGMMIIEACKTHLLPFDPVLGFYMWRVAKIEAVEMNRPIAAKELLQKP